MLFYKGADDAALLKGALRVFLCQLQIRCVAELYAVWCQFNAGVCQLLKFRISLTAQFAQLDQVVGAGRFKAEGCQSALKVPFRYFSAAWAQW
mgnify:CR=1 FL=1